ncbi:hypothetical protein LO762_18930 [Actinocorallia sp. API 0066]|uniref:hypothetical protein n=1 Tax=Actinocorallia sp. API 0066 TaxID=2896846 RepID=UPI001E2B1F03|nr:hypothetical protein [Actinocorallia sp. API 0066]MCD0451255.1 hypothetical protein [Actinocorallia sp. API 0066]
MTLRPGYFLPLLGLAAGLLVLGPALAPGFVLSYDMVFVPDPARTGAMFGTTGGFPRQVPSDAVAAALSFVPYSQQFILLTIFVLAAWGMSRLVPGPWPGKAAAAVFYVWNPYVAERLLLGHWALLLGYAGLPWVLDAVLRRRRLWAALLPAAIGGFAAMNLTLLVVVAGLVVMRGRGAVKAGVTFVVLALPWLVPALLQASGTRTDPLGVDLFAARADTPFGTFGSLLSLGGIWNAETVPPGYASFFTALLRLLLVCACLAALVRAPRTDLERAALLAGSVGLALASIGITGPGRAALRGLVEWTPAFGVLRDGQLYVGVLALAAAVGLGRLAASAPWAVIVPVALLPGLAWGAFGTLRSVDFPDDWLRAQKAINADPVEGKVLSLPWGAYRRFEWNHGRAVMDPLPRMVSRHVVWDDGFTVGDRTLANEDPLAVEAARLLDGPGGLTRPLAEAGYRYVVISKDASTAALRARFTGAEPLLDGPALLVLRLDHTG